MPQILDVEGAPLAPESIHMLEYVAKRAPELTAAAIRDKIRPGRTGTGKRHRPSQ